MESKNFSAMNFEEQVTLDTIKAVGYAYTYQRKLALKTLKSMLNDVEEKYGIESAQYREITILYHIILKG